MSYYLHDLIIEGLGEFSIQNCQISGGIGEHTTLILLGTVKKEEDFLYKRKDLHPISLYVRGKDGKKDLFHGLITEAGIYRGSNQKTIKIIAKSYSYLLDIQKNSRSFQDTSMSYAALINKVLLAYEGVQCIFSIPNKEIGKLIVQYEETDWEFLKRVLSDLETTLSPASEKKGTCLYAGLPELNRYPVDYELLQIERDLNTFYYLKANDQPCKDAHFTKFTINTGDIRNLFERVKLEDKTLTIRNFTYQFVKSELTATYVLQKAAGLKRKRRYPMHLIGVAIKGSIIAVNGDKVKVHLDIDETNNKNCSYWFPFSTLSASTDGTGWYFMPEIGDVIRVYFPTKHTKQAIAISSASKYKAGGGQSDRMGDTNVKYLRTKQGKEMVLSPNCIRLNCNDQADVVISNTGKVTISANKKVKMDAKKIEISAVNDISFHAKKGIRLQSIQGAYGELTKDITFCGTEVKAD